MQSEYEYALLLAANLCADDPEDSDKLLAFRSIYSSFIDTDNAQRIREFHDAVGIEFPTTANENQVATTSIGGKDVDVIIPIHNALEHVTACISSLLEKANVVQRIILVDDGSNESTARFLSEVATKNTFVTLIRSEQQRGFTESMTTGLNLSKAPVFVALNSDTTVDGGWLEKLIDVYNSAENVGMVGPLSNSAAWQNLFEPFSEDGNFQKHEVPNADRLKSINDRLNKICGGEYPNSALVHGFCAMVNRRAFDEIGGLDKDSFPLGYGEFQDLSLRLWDAGYQLTIASHCFVAHVGFASIDSKIRSDLSRFARATLYRKHTALRYLTAESASAFSQPLRIIRDRFHDL